MGSSRVGAVSWLEGTVLLDLVGRGALLSSSSGLGATDLFLEFDESGMERSRDSLIEPDGPGVLRLIPCCCGRWDRAYGA